MTSLRPQVRSNRTAPDKRELTCWLLADNTRTICKEPTLSNRQEMKALLKHTLLFNVFQQRLVLSDSQTINNPTLRLLFRDDDDVRTLLQESQMFGVAARLNQSGHPLHLGELVAEQKLNGKYMFHEGNLGTGDELEFVWDSTLIVPYDLPTIGRRFETEAVRIFDTPQAHGKLGKTVSKRIYDFARKEREWLNKEGTNLGLMYFYDTLKHKLGDKLWEKHRDGIYQLAQAPYQTGLPAILNADPIYAAEHARSFELVRGVRQSRAYDLRRFEFDGRLGLAAYAKGIELLKPDDIFDLIDSPEATAFAAARDAAEATEKASRQLAKALREYVYLIEDCIIRRHNDLKQESAEGIKHEVQVSFEDYARDGRIAVSGTDIAKVVNYGITYLGLFVGWAGFLSAFLGQTVFDRLADQEIQRLLREERAKAAEQNEKKDSLRAEFDKAEERKLRFELKQPIAADSVGGATVPPDEIEVHYR